MEIVKLGHEYDGIQIIEENFRMDDEDYNWIKMKLIKLIELIPQECQISLRMVYVDQTYYGMLLGYIMQKEHKKVSSQFLPIYQVKSNSELTSKPSPTEILQVANVDKNIKLCLKKIYQETMKKINNMGSHYKHFN